MAGIEQSKDGGRLRHPLVGLCSGVTLVLGCCILLALDFRPAVDVNTFWPERGMTMDEVRARYGPPSKVEPVGDGRTHWYYYTDRLGLGLVGVEFDEAGRVTGSWDV